MGSGASVTALSALETHDVASRLKVSRTGVVWLQQRFLLLDRTGDEKLTKEDLIEDDVPAMPYLLDHAFELTEDDEVTLTAFIQAMVEFLPGGKDERRLHTLFKFMNSSRSTKTPLTHKQLVRCCAAVLPDRSIEEISEDVSSFVESEGDGVAVDAASFVSYGLRHLDSIQALMEEEDDKYPADVLPPDWCAGGQSPLQLQLS